MKRGNKTSLAKLAGIKPQSLSDYLAGRAGASSAVANRLSEITGSDIRIWLKMGDAASRLAAIESWAESLPKPKSAPCGRMSACPLAAGLGHDAQNL
jgi:plasmid maintenance system antidote protein VapI